MARMQAHRAALLNLGPDKAVVFYKDFRPATKETPERHFCAAGLVTTAAGSPGLRTLLRVPCTMNTTSGWAGWKA